MPEKTEVPEKPEAPERSEAPERFEWPDQLPGPSVAPRSRRLGPLRTQFASTKQPRMTNCHHASYFAMRRMNLSNISARKFVS